jgi:hypothetical protein
VADRIVLQKLGVAFAPAQKITPLKRENRDSDKRRFERQLTTENEKKAEDTIELDADIEKTAGEDGGAGNGAFAGGEKGQGPGSGDQADAEAPPGSVVDIRV